jgi:hypothetical protein
LSRVKPTWSMVVPGSFEAARSAQIVALMLADRSAGLLACYRRAQAQSQSVLVL